MAAVVGSGASLTTNAALAATGVGLPVALFNVAAGLFGSSAEKRAAAEARAILNRARLEGIARSQAYEEEFTPFVSMSREALGEAGSYGGLLQNIIMQTQGIEVGEGLSSADKIAYEDAAKLLNEQMVSTGNLRSGAAAFGQAQLLRRVVADASERRFNRQVAKLGLLFGGQNQAVSQAMARAQTAGQIGLYGKQLSSGLLQAAMGLAPAAASAKIQEGKAESAMWGFAGQGAGALTTALGNFGNTTTTPIDVGAKYGVET